MAEKVQAGPFIVTKCSLVAKNCNEFNTFSVSVAAARSKLWRLAEWYQRAIFPYADVRSAWWSYHFASPAHRADAEAELIRAERAVSPFLTELRTRMERASSERAYREAEAARRTFRSVMRSAIGGAS
jgi:hypothetical protein